MNAIKIVALPPGEAPQNVREAWVGLVLPLALPGQWKGRGAGVLTGPKNSFSRLLWRLADRQTVQQGYIVESATALRILAFYNPEAACWWQENTPDFLIPGRGFMFAAHVCEETQEATWPPPPECPAA